MLGRWQGHAARHTPGRRGGHRPRTAAPAALLQVRQAVTRWRLARALVPPAPLLFAHASR